MNNPKKLSGLRWRYVGAGLCCGLVLSAMLYFSFSPAGNLAELAAYERIEQMSPSRPEPWSKYGWPFRFIGHSSPNQLPQGSWFSASYLIIDLLIALVVLVCTFLVTSRFWFVQVAPVPRFTLFQLFIVVSVTAWVFAAHPWNWAIMMAMTNIIVIGYVCVVVVVAYGVRLRLRGRFGFGAGEKTK